MFRRMTLSNTTGIGLALLLLASVLALPPVSYGQASAGDQLVIDANAGTNGNGALFIVNPVTGSRTILSDFGNASQGPTGVNPVGVTVDASGTILVIDFSGYSGSSVNGALVCSCSGIKGALFTVSPVNGNRTILSDFGNATQGPLGENLLGVAVESSGTILVIDADAGTSSDGALFAVNPSTGSRTILSDFGQATQGPLGADPEGVTVDASGTILVSDRTAGTSFHGALFTVNPSTGARTLLSDFGQATQGPLGVDPHDVAVESSGTILVIDPSAGTSIDGALFTVNPTTGARTLLSDFGNATQGPLGLAPLGVAVESSGTILVSDPGAGTSNDGALFTVNPTTGARTLLSDFGNATQGPLGKDPFDVVTFTGGTGVDNFPPDTTILSATANGKNTLVNNGGKTGSTSIQFTFTGTDNVAVGSFQCSLDSAAFSACSSPTNYTNLTGGTHVFEVRAVDTSGNVDPTPATFSWFVSGKRGK